MLSKLNMPTAIVASTSILALVIANSVCLVTHQPVEVVATVSGAGSVLGILASAVMHSLFSGGSDA